MSNTPKNKLWQKAYDLDAKIEAFTVGRDRELDLQLAPFDIAGSLAHGKMLSEVGLLPPAEYELLAEQLRQLYHKALDGEFGIKVPIHDWLEADEHMTEADVSERI